MKKIYYSLLYLCLIIFAFHPSYAQEPAPPIGNLVTNLIMDINGVSISISPTSRWDLYTVLNEFSTVNEGHGYGDLLVSSANLVGYCQKPGAGNENKYYALGRNGYVSLRTVTISGGHINVTSVSGGKWNLSVSSPAFTKIAGDALYILDDGQIGKSNDGGTTWAFDTAGIAAGYASDFALDTAQNVYAADGTKLYYQSGTATTWTQVATFPSGMSPQSVYVDRRDRIFVGTGSQGVYNSTNGGGTWIQGNTGLSGVSPKKMCDDVFGNIYAIDQSGDKLFRSTDGGINWTRIDTPISNQAAATLFLPTIINAISGDTVLVAATLYGRYFSRDQGTTWMAQNSGISEQSLKGFHKCSNGRIVETSNNGVFYLDASSSTWQHTLPVDGYATLAGGLYEDTLGHLYQRGVNAYSAAPTMISSDCGTTWQSDTSGLYLLSSGTPIYWVDKAGYEHIALNDFNKVTLYVKAPGGSYTPDTLGIGVLLGNYLSIGGFGSDGAYLYASGNTGSYPHTWRRPLAGGTWAVDTTGTNGMYFKAMIPDQSGNLIASPLYQSSGLMYRHSGSWSNIPYPSGIVSYANVSALATDASNGIIAAFSTYDFVNSTNIGLGIYCTHDYGSTWSLVGLDSVYVAQLVNQGDSTYAITNNIGVYALTCAGVVISPTGIVEISRANDPFTLYPNPTNGLCHLTIPGSTPAPSEALITDLTGRIVLRILVAANSEELSFDTKDINGGIYLCTFNSISRKLVVEK